MKVEFDTSARAPILLPVSPAVPVRFAPDPDKRPALAYLVRPPTFRSRAAAEHEAMPVLLRLPGDREFNAAALAAVDRVVKAAQRDAVREVLAGFQALLDDGERMKDDPDARAALAREARSIHAQLTPHDGDLQRLMADRLLGVTWAQFVAARHHLAGWDGLTDKAGRPVPFAAGPDGLATEACLSRLPPQDVPAIAGFVERLSEPDDDLKKS
ncbi:MAG: hypothetical protein SFV21_00290 [Rhodospirillaceae bacterium]|nr:hypothetical protein [Rhodospirillaceae bacterium]